MEERLEPIVVTPPQEIDVGNSDESVLRTTQGADSPAEPIVETPAKPQIVNTILVKEVKYLIAKAIKEILPKLGFKTEVVDQLPLTGENGVIYFVPNGGENPNVYDEYVWVSSTNEFEKIGSTELPLNYVTTDTDQAITGVKTFTKIDIADTTFIIIKDGNNKGEVGQANNNFRFYDNNIRVNTPTLRPQSSNTTALGDSNNKFTNLYLSNSVTFNAGAEGETTWSIQKDGANQLAVYSGSNKIYNIQGGSIYTVNSNGASLGRSGNPWTDLYLSGKVDFGDGATITKDSSNRLNLNMNNTPIIKVGGYGGQTYIASSFSPDSSSLDINLGRDSVRWNNLYLKGVISDGTNSVSVADLAALITYAKGQGWIS